MCQIYNKKYCSLSLVVEEKSRELSKLDIVLRIVDKRE